MHRKNVIFVLAVFVIASSCAEKPNMGKQPDSNRTALSVSEAVTPTNIGRTVIIRGLVKQVCQDEGCWMDITDGKTSLRVTFKDEAFAMPMTLQGTVVVEGVVTEEIEGNSRVAKMIAVGVVAD